MFNFYDFKHHHSKFIALTSHSMARPITSRYIHRQRAAKALHGNLHLFKRFVDIKTKKDHHNLPFWSRADCIHSLRAEVEFTLLKRNLSLLEIWQAVKKYSILLFPSISSPKFMSYMYFQTLGSANFAVLPLFVIESTISLVLLRILFFIKVLSCYVLMFVHVY